MPNIKLKVPGGDFKSCLSAFRSALSYTDLLDDNISLTAFFSERETLDLMSDFGVREFFAYGRSLYGDVIDQFRCFNEFNIASSARIGLSERYDVPVYDWDERNIGYRMLVTCADSLFHDISPFYKESGLPHRITEIYGDSTKAFMIGCEFPDHKLAVSWLLKLRATWPALLEAGTPVGFCYKSAIGIDLPESVNRGMISNISVLGVNPYGKDFFSINPSGGLRSIPNTTLSALENNPHQLNAMLMDCSQVSIRRQSFGWKVGEGGSSRRQSGNYVNFLWSRGRANLSIGIEQYSDEDVPISVVKKFLQGKIL